MNDEQPLNIENQFPVFICHVLKGDPKDYTTQICFSMCVNNYIKCDIGEDIIWERDNDEVPIAIVGLIDYLKKEGVYNDWMDSAERICIFKRFITNTEV